MAVRSKKLRWPAIFTIGLLSCLVTGLIGTDDVIARDAAVVTGAAGTATMRKGTMDPSTGSSVTSPKIQMRWLDPAANLRTLPQSPREYHAGYLYIPYRGVPTTNHPNSIEGLVCTDFSPSNSVFTQEAGTWFNALSISCAIDESQITVRPSLEDANDSANECFSNASYCDALWIDNQDHTISFLKYQ